MVFEAIQGGVQLPGVTARADGQQGQPTRIPGGVRPAGGGHETAHLR